MLLEESLASGEPSPTTKGAVTHAVPVIFGPGERALFGFYHAPSEVLTRPVAVVLCNPLGYEAMSAHRTYRHLAERLAARGFPAFRFDYDGTGDSAGKLDDPERLRSWLGSIKAAIAEVRARSGAPKIALFGVRFGATLAALAAIEEGDVEALIAWVPVFSGRQHVRELRSFKLIKELTPTAPRTDGSAEVGGYVFSGETLNEIGRIDLLGGTQRVARRVLVLPRTERSKEEARLVARLTETGSEVKFEAKPGYTGMMKDDPYETEVPFATLDAVVDWLDDGTRAPARVSSLSGSRASSFVVTRADKKLIETPLTFGEGGRLFGVLTEPEGTVRRDRPVLFFLNVGANHHVGPHRMNVELAREMASRGYLALRMDAGGLGESRVARAGVPENRIYTKDSVADVQDAMTLVGEMRGASRYVLVGLCSGAYLAYHTAIVDPRVAGQALISPFAFEWEEGDSVSPTMRKPFRSTRFYVRALRDSKVWLRALRGDIDLKNIAGVLLERLHTRMDIVLPMMSALLSSKTPPQNEVEQSFRAMCKRGVESLMVLSVEDGGVDMVAEYLGTDARRMRPYRNFKFQILEGADHTFMTGASQAMLRELLTNFVSTRF